MNQTLFDRARRPCLYGYTEIDGSLIKNGGLTHQNVQGDIPLNAQIGVLGADRMVMRWRAGNYTGGYLALAWDPRYNCWALESNGSTALEALRFPSSTSAGARTLTDGGNWARYAPWLNKGVYLGGDVGVETQTLLLSAPSIPTTVADVSASAATYEAGDVVWNSAPAPAGALGWTCTTKGTMTTLAGVTGSIDSGNTVLTLSPSTTDLQPGQYVQIGGVSGVKRVANRGTTTTAAAAAQGATSITVTSTVGLAVGERLVVASILVDPDANPATITNIVGSTVTFDFALPAAVAAGTTITFSGDPGTGFVILDSAADATVAGATVDYAPADFVPFAAFAGVGEVTYDTSAGGPFTLGAEVNYGILWFTGAPAAGVTVIFPAPAADADAYERTVRNTTGQTLTIGTGAGATVAIADGSTARIGFDATNGAFSEGSTSTTSSTASLQKAEFTTSGTWTAPAGVSQVMLVGFGGGGGGGGGSGGAGFGVLDTFPCGGGGGGGARSSSIVLSVDPGHSYDVTIGDGGGGGAGGGDTSNGSNGADGDATTLADGATMLATFTGATGGLGGSRRLNTSPTVYFQAAGGGAPGNLRPPSNVSGFSDPYRQLATGYGAGGDGTDSHFTTARAGWPSVLGFAGGLASIAGADAGTNRGGGAGGGGGGGPDGVGGDAGPGGNAHSGTGGDYGTNGNAAGPLGVSANTGAGGGGGGAGASSSSAYAGGNGGAGGHGGSGRLVIAFVS